MIDKERRSRFPAPPFYIIGASHCMIQFDFHQFRLKFKDGFFAFSDFYRVAKQRISIAFELGKFNFPIQILYFCLIIVHEPLLSVHPLFI